MVLVLGALLAALIARSTPRRVGDGGEYFGMAFNLAALEPPAFSGPDLTRLEQRFAQLGQAFGGALPETMPPGIDGRHDAVHFWLYPALAAPLLALTERLGLHPNMAFTIVNLVFLLGAAWIVSGTLGGWLTLLLMAGPIIWWIDKAHTEVFTFSLFACTFAWLETHPALALVALGAACAQNPALALVFPIVCLVAWRSSGRTLSDPRLLAGVLCGVALAALPLAYYEWHLGVSSPLLAATSRHVPGLAELTPVLLDANIGLLPNFPPLAGVVLPAVLLLAARAPGRLVSLEIAGAAVAGLLLLAAFAQSTNLNHGATPGMSRYALWLIPLAIPLLRQPALVDGPRARRWVAALTIVSCAWAVLEFEPRRPERHLLPTPLAAYLWARHPGLDNPPIEIFGERVSGVEPAALPTATADCSKILLVRGAWPVPCPPFALPPRCASVNDYCYANRTGQTYAFVPVDEPHNYTPNARIWPATPSGIGPLGRTLGRINWTTMRLFAASEDGAMLRAAHEVAWAVSLQADDRLLVYAAAPRAGASVTLRIPGPMNGNVIDLDGDRIAAVLELRPPAGEPVSVALPPGLPDVAVVLTSAR